MIVLLHVATGGLAGALTGSRLGALALGPLLHALGDVLPHEDTDSMAFETASGSALLTALVLHHGATSPIAIGAAAASAPDVEHVLLKGREIFPTHVHASWHRSGGIPVWAQLVLAGAIATALLALRPARNG